MSILNLADPESAMQRGGLNVDCLTAPVSHGNRIVVLSSAPGYLLFTPGPQARVICRLMLVYHRELTV